MTADDSPASPSQLQRAETLLEFVTDKILNKFNKTSISSLATKKFSSSSQMRTVVLVGEVSRGKSALANALIGTKDISPVGVDFTTAVPVGIGPVAEMATPSCQLFYSDRVEDIAGDQLGNAIDGNLQAQKLKNGEEVPTRAFATVANPLLDAVIVDTPGVGGLDISHAKLAYASAEQASVLVMVCDASTPITAPEMSFLKDVSRQTDNVIVAVTKLDKHFSRYEEIVAKNKELIHEHLGRAIPVIGVSSLLALFDASDLPEEEITRIRAHSGIADLREMITKRFEASENLPAINGLRIALEGLKDLKRELEDKTVALTGAEKALPELEQELEELQKLKLEMERWEQYLTRDLTHVRQRAIDSLDQKLEDIRQKWTNTVSKQGMAVLRKSSQHYTSLIEKDFQAAVVDTLGLLKDDFEEKIVRPRFESDMVWEEIAQEISDAFEGKKLNTGEVKKKTEGILDPMMLVMGASGGSLIGTALAGVISFSGLGIVAGVGWVAFNLGFRAMRSGKQNLLTWLRETIGTTKVFTNRLVEATIANARPVIVIRYREYLKKAISDAQANVQSAQNAARMETDKRKKTLDNLEKNLAILDKNIGRLEQMIQILRDDVTTPARGN